MAEWRAAIARLLPEAERVLCDLIRYPSTPGHEHEAVQYLEAEFLRIGAEVERLPFPPSITEDPDYSTPVAGISYEGRYNLRVLRRGSGGGKNLLLNAHVDVVPPSEGMEHPWGPRREGGVVRGRGACDDKGAVAAIYLLFAAAAELGIHPRGDWIAHLVNEEENGGNGSLAMARAGERADACVVLEPTDHRVLSSIRGAVWFHLELTGKAGHSGQAGQTRSALLMARDAVAALERYHAELLASSRGFPLFDLFPNPMPITFGTLHAGSWPATAPSHAVLEGVLGFLPNKTRDQVCAEMRRALEGAADEWLARNMRLGFMYRHDSSVLDPGHELPQGLLRAAARAGVPSQIGAMTASCDAWLYNNQLGIPTVVYGPGSLSVAHSREEQIVVEEIGRSAEVLARFGEELCAQGVGR